MGCNPITTYPSDLLEDIPWENDVKKLTLQHCTSHHEKLKGDLASLDLLSESRKFLEIVLHSGKFIDVCHSISPTTYDSFELMRRWKEEMMGPDKWLEVENRVSKQQAISMFKF